MHLLVWWPQWKEALWSCTAYPYTHGPSTDAPLPPSHPANTDRIKSFFPRNVVESAQTLGHEYFAQLRTIANTIPKNTWENIQVTTAKDKNRISKSALAWIDWIQTDAGAKEITRRTYLWLLLEFVRIQFLNRKGYSGNPNTQNMTRYNWARDLVRFVSVVLHDHVRLGNTDMNKYIRKMLPNWHRHSTFIGLQAPLYRSKDAKFWSGEVLLMLGYDEAFPEGALDKITNWFQMNENQRVWFVDWIEYDLMMRQCEAIRTSPRKTKSGKGMGLYWRDFSEQVFTDNISFGNRSVGALRGFLDRQKNETNSSKFQTINNKFVASLDDDVPPEWLNEKDERLFNRRFCTRRKLWSVLLGYNILRTDKKILLPMSGLAPVFPEVPVDFKEGDPPPMYNMHKTQVDRIRRQVYAKYIPAWALGLLSGHCWRGGKHGYVILKHGLHVTLPEGEACRM